MALITLGTAATTTLQGIQFQRWTGHYSDWATFNSSVLNDQINGSPIWPGAFRNGILQIPNRGQIQLLPGDYIAFDSTGWPVILSAKSAASVSWVHT